MLQKVINFGKALEGVVPDEHDNVRSFACVVGDKEYAFVKELTVKDRRNFSLVSQVLNVAMSMRTENKVDKNVARTESVLVQREMVKLVLENTAFSGGVVEKVPRALVKYFGLLLDFCEKTFASQHLDLQSERGWMRGAMGMVTVALLLKSAGYEVDFDYDKEADLDLEYDVDLIVTKDSKRYGVDVTARESGKLGDEDVFLIQNLPDDSYSRLPMSFRADVSGVMQINIPPIGDRRESQEFYLPRYRALGVPSDKAVDKFKSTIQRLWG